MEIQNLTMKIKDRTLFNSLCLKLDKEKINIIVGPNGVGKSTLLDVMAGLHETRKSSLIDFPKESEIAYQLQGVPFLTTLTGKDIFTLFIKCDYKYKSVFDLQQLDLDRDEQNLLQRLFPLKFGYMSGGERRWLIITAICCLKRKLYLFDEPTSGIDPEYKEKVYFRLEKLATREDATIIMTSHQLHDLAYYNCVIYFLNEGKIEFKGTYKSFIKFGGSINPDKAFQFIKKGKLNK